MIYDTVLSGRIYHRNRFVDCYLGLEAGKIAKISTDRLEGNKYYNFGSRAILPSAIDIHVHFREPGKTEKEDFATGTMAAAFGGVTCTLDMPNTIPPVCSKDSFIQKLELVREKAFVDFGLYGALLFSADISGLGAVSSAFKLYLTWKENANFDEEMLRKIFLRVGQKVIAVHCEDNRLMSGYEPQNLEQHLVCRPNRCEAETVAKIAQAANAAERNAQAPKIHIAHVSARESLHVIASSKLSSEVTPFHLFFTVQSAAEMGNFAKVEPPLRTATDRDALWIALNNGTISILASDHAPHTIEEKKELPFAAAPSGVPGVETMFPVMLHAVRYRKLLSIARLIDAVATLPAELFRLNKGRLEEGYDADLIVLDFRHEKKLRADMLHSKCGWTPFENYPAIFPSHVMLRGEFVIENCELVGKPGYGKPMI